MTPRGCRPRCFRAFEREPTWYAFPSRYHEDVARHEPTDHVPDAGDEADDRIEPDADVRARDANEVVEDARDRGRASRRCSC